MSPQARESGLTAALAGFIVRSTRATIVAGAALRTLETCADVSDVVELLVVPPGEGPSAARPSL